MLIKGKGISEGVAIDKPYVCTFGANKIKQVKIENINGEISKVHSARDKAIVTLDKLYKSTKRELDEDKAQIFIGHKLLLEDDELVYRIIEIIKSDKVNAQWAIKLAEKEFVSMFLNMKSSYLKERTVDIKDVCNRLINIINGKVDDEYKNITGIIVAKELTPSQMVGFNKEKIKGIITEKGGANSHAAIIARALEIPAITNIKDATVIFKVINNVVVDADNDMVIIEPSEQCINHYKELEIDRRLEKEKLLQYLGKEDKTKDGYKVDIFFNIADVNDVKIGIKNDSHGIGLFRTEFIYMNREKSPTEEEHYKTYKEIADLMGDKPIIIRTLDIGGDKKVDYMNIEKEGNPFLGYRAIRYCLDNEYDFIKQIKGILRASYNTNIKIMFPMISSIEELRKSKEILEKAKRILIQENKDFNKNIKVGMMIETPAAALMSDIFAKEVDFFSIGTNDLTQYMVAVDRNNEKVEKLYNPYNLGVLRAINMTINNGHKQGIRVGVCGEIASDMNFIPIILGMGIDELSVNPSKVLEVRKLINGLTKDKFNVNYLTVTR